MEFFAAEACSTAKVNYFTGVSVVYFNEFDQLEGVVETGHSLDFVVVV